MHRLESYTSLIQKMNKIIIIKTIHLTFIKRTYLRLYIINDVLINILII